jgi:hypothetical protein
MNDFQLLKIQNTINEIQNQLKKIYVDTPVFRVLMQRAVNQLNELVTHIGYLEKKIENNTANVSNFQPTCIIDSDWNLNLSHGIESDYLLTGEAIQMLVEHIKYMHVLIENCPGAKND